MTGSRVETERRQMPYIIIGKGVTIIEAPPREFRPGSISGPIAFFLGVLAFTIHWTSVFGAGSTIFMVAMAASLGAVLIGGYSSLGFAHEGSPAGERRESMHGLFGLLLGSASIIFGLAITVFSRINVGGL